MTNIVTYEIKDCFGNVFVTFPDGITGEEYFYIQPQLLAEYWGLV